MMSHLHPNTNVDMNVNERTKANKSTHGQGNETEDRHQHSGSSDINVSGEDTFIEMHQLCVMVAAEIQHTGNVVSKGMSQLSL